MINCALTPDQVARVYKVTWLSMKDQNKSFDPNIFMQDLFNKIKDKSDAENAAKFIQPIPDLMIGLVSENSRELRKLGVKLDLNKLQELSELYFDETNGIGNIIKDFSKSESDIKNIVDQKKEDELNENRNEDKVSISKIINLPARLKTYSPLTGTIQNFVTIDPNSREILFSEKTDPAKETIINTLTNMRYSEDLISNNIGEFVYQGRVIKLRAIPLLELRKNNPNDIDATTEKEIVRSLSIEKQGTAPSNVTQAKDRVALVITDKYGNYIRFDKQGNITDQGGKLVYQFLRDVRKKDGKYQATDIYGKETRVLQASELASVYDITIDEAQKILDSAYDSVIDIKNKVINKGQSVLLNITGLTNGVASELTDATLPLNNLRLVPGIDAYKTVQSIKIGTSKENKGRAVIYINGTEFSLDRVRLSPEIINEIAEVVTNKNISKEQRKAFVEQFIYNDTKKKNSIELITVNGQFSINDINNNNIISLSGESFNNLSDAQINLVKERVKKLLTERYKDGDGYKRAFMQYNQDLLNVGSYSRYNIETGKFEKKDFIEFLLNQSAPIYLSKLDPGFYNILISYSDPNSTIAKDLSKAKEEVDLESNLKSYVRETKDKLVETLKEKDNNQLDTTIEFVDTYRSEMGYKTNTVFIKNPNEDSNVALVATLPISVNQGDQVVLKLEDLDVDKDSIIPDVIKVYLKKGKELISIGTVAETDFTQGEKPRSAKVKKAIKEIEVNDQIGNTNLPNPNSGGIADLFDGTSLQRKGYKASKETKAQIEQASDWWKNSPLSKYIELGHMGNIVNSNTFAQFTINAATLIDPTKLARIEINKGKGTAVDIYHEAWHGFTQLFLTKDQKQSLYDEVKNSSEKFKDLSYFEIEELLAEDFRTYALNPKPKSKSPKRNTLFRKILNFIKELFGKKKNTKVKKEGVIIDTLSVPAVKELFEKLYLASTDPSLLNDYTPLVDNVFNERFKQLNRGARNVNNPKRDALSIQDSKLIVESIDSIMSEVVDDLYMARRKNNESSLNSGTLNLLLDENNKAVAYKIVKKRLEERLETLKTKFNNEVGTSSFNDITSLNGIKNNAVAVLKGGKGTRDRYVFLSSQITDFDNLDADIRRGQRILGANYRGIDVVGSFYTHNKIKFKNRPVDILVVDSINDAVTQLENYEKAEDTSYTDIVNIKQGPQLPKLNQSQQVLLNNIRILQAAVDNFGDSKSGIMKYHIDNSRFSIINKTLDQTDNVDEVLEEESDNDKDTETIVDKSVGKKSLQQLADKESLYIIKSLHKTNIDGSIPRNQLGFKQLADFKVIWNTLTNTISGTKSPIEMYDKLVKLSEQFPELKQLVTTKLPKPKNTTNTFEFDAIASFWQTFKRPALKYYQLTAENTGEGYSLKVNEAAIDTFSIMNEFKANFETKEASEYIIKDDANKNTLNLQKVINDFGSNGQINKDKAVEFLNTLGINIDNIERVRKDINENFDYYGPYYIYRIANNFAKIQNKNVDQVTQEELEYLNKFITNPVKTLGENMPKSIGTNQITQIGRLAQLQSKYGIVSKNYGVLTADGQRVFPHINDHSTSITVDGLNRIDNLANAFKNEGENNEPNQFNYLSWLNPKVNSFTRRSQVLNSLFQIDTNTFRKRRGTSLELFISSGVNIQDNKKASSKTTDLDKYSKFSQEFHSMLMSGIQEFMRHADKKSSFGARVVGGIVSPISLGEVKKDKNLYVDVEKFDTTGGDGPVYAVVNIILPYLAAEFERIKKFQENKAELSKITGYNRDVGNGRIAGEVFTAFDDILLDETKEELYNLKLTSSDDLVTYLNSNPELQQKIVAQIMNYFENKSNEYIRDYLNESPFIDPKLVTKLNLSEVPGETKAETNRRIQKSLMDAYAYNSWIHNFEMIHLLYGDMAQYNHAKEELGKRAPGSTSGGEGFLTDINSQNFINDVWNKNTWASTIGNEQNGIKPFTYNGKMNTAVVQDSIKRSKYIDDIKDALTEDYRSRKKYSESQIKELVKQDLKPYEKMEESDGGGWITIDAYRTLKKLQNSWDPAQEALYQKILAGEKISVQDAKTYFPIYKLHYFGALDNAPIATTAMHKFALMPLIPTVIKNSELEQLHNRMMQENIQYVTFGTGSKVSTLTSNGTVDDIYTDDTQTKIKPYDKEKNIFTPNVIYLEYLKDVTKVNTSYKEKITFPTQKRGILLDGLFDQGLLLNDSNRTAINNYKNAVNSYTNVLKQELLSEIGFKWDGKNYTSINGDYTKLMELAQNELGKRGLPEQLKSLLNTNMDGSKSMDLSIHPRPDEIEKVILAVIQNRLIKQKVKGEALIQAPVSLFNGLWNSGYEGITDPKEIKKLLGTNGLPFYTRDPKRTGAMKVAIALQGDFENLLNAKDNDGNTIDTIDRLNEMIKDPKWLEKNRESITIAGPRIPTDATNSVEFAEVWHFLDPAGGNKIIVPTEIVAKAGSDFDVDKLFFMYPALDSEGKVIKTKYTQKQLNDEIERGEVKASVLIEQQKKALHNNLIKAITDVLSLPDNYASLVKPNSTYLVEGVVDFLQKNSSEYDRFQNVNNGERMIGDKKSISPTRALEVGYNLHKHEVNLTGSVTLGISAVKNKMHPIFKSIGFKMPKGYKTRYGSYKKIYLKLKHNKTSDGSISLSHNQSVDGTKITDTFSHMLNAILDRAKNPFPFDLRATPQGINVINYLLEAGVVADEVFLFMNQPLIAEYLKLQAKLASSFATIDGSSEYRIKKSALKELLGKEEADKIQKEGEKYLLNKFPKDTNISKELLMKEIIEGGTDKELGLALLYHFMDIENTITGLSALQSIATPDTQYVRTIQQVGQRQKKLKNIEKLPTLDSTSVDKLINNSILSSFRQEKLMRDVLNPLFDIRLNPNITRYIGEKLVDDKRNIQRKYGTGVDGAERFSTLFNNAIIDYIFQNNILPDFVENGKPVKYPKQYKGYSVSFIKTGNKAVSFDGNKILINRDQLEKDYKNKAYSDIFSVDQNPFPTADSYIRYAMETEYLKSKVYTADNLSDNKQFTRLAKKLGKEKALKEFIAEKALMNTFNRSYIMGLTKFSYTQSVLDIINEFPTLKDRFPVTRQLSKARLKKGQKEQILELNDKDIAEGELAEGYSNDLKQLGNINISKADNPVDNQRITEIFKVFSLMATYQQGVGFSKYSMANIIDPSKFVKLMEQPGQTFINEMNNKTINTIYNRFMNDLVFKNYIIDTPSPQESIEEIETIEEDIVEQTIIERNGIDEVYNTNDALSEIGTQEEYQEYLSTIFPNSMMTDVVYRGESKTKQREGAANLGKGIYYATTQEKAGRYGDITPALVNIQNPLIVDIVKNDNRGFNPGNVTVKEASTNKDNPDGKDALIAYEYILPELYDKYNKYTGHYTGEVNADGTPVENQYKQQPFPTEMALASRSQVYELGSQKDLDGFAEFIDKKPGSEDIGKDPVNDGPESGTQLDMFGPEGFQIERTKKEC